MKYVTIAGRYIKGARLNGEGSLVAKFVGAGYQQVRCSAVRQSASQTASQPAQVVQTVALLLH